MYELIDCLNILFSIYHIYWYNYTSLHLPFTDEQAKFKKKSFFVLYKYISIYPYSTLVTFRFWPDEQAKFQYNLYGFKKLISEDIS